MPTTCAAHDAATIRETARLAALHSFHLVGGPADAALDRLAEFSASSLGMPMAAISFVDRDWQWLHARAGLDATRLPRSVSFCHDTIAGDGVFVVADARDDAHFCHHPLVADRPGIRFHAGAPLVTAEGHRVGTLSVMDTAPRDGFGPDERQSLTALAALVMDRLELRRGGLANAAAAGLAQAAGYAFMTIDADGIVTFVNPACEALYGYTRSEMLGRTMDFIIPEPFRGAHKAGLARIAAGGPSKLSGRTVEVNGLREDGSIFPMEFSLSVWRDATGIGVGAIMRDISDWRARDDRLMQMAHHDGLTGLANRTLFDERLNGALEAGRNVTVMLLDLDGFKEVNDSLGHGTGDTLLQAVAVRLASCIGRDTTLARFGGDEFALLLPETADPLKAAACGSAILEAFQAPFQVCAHTFHVGLSIGAALGGEGASTEELIADSDLALYQAKRDGRRCFRLFEPAMRSAVIARRTLHDELTHALESGELVLHYQPQVALQTRQVIGVEALLRWQHPQRGLQLPGAFIGALEAHPLAPAIGRWIIEEACRQAAQWRAARLPPIRVAVNLFGAQLQSGQLAGEVMSSLARYNLPPQTLEIEVTERIALQAEDAILDPIRELHRRGVGVAFDDFGTGYASLSSLKRFPLSRLKIDRSFVRDLLTDRHDADIIRAVLGMAQSFGLDVIAEGIETVEQEAVLRAMGCREGQGYLYGKAMGPQALQNLVKQGLEGERDVSAA